jgi:hypothetical protein
VGGREQPGQDESPLHSDRGFPAIVEHPERLSLAPRFGGAFAYLSDMSPREPKSKLLTGTDYDSGWRR